MPVEPLLEVDEVTKQYGQVLVYGGLSFDVKQDEFVTIFGPSGCGKTTLLKLLGALEEPTSGEIRFKGQDINEFTEEYKDKSAFVWQSDRLAPWRTAAGNIELALSLRDPSIDQEEVQQRIDEALQFVNLENFADALPRNLSGGMRQRVNLARALSLNSEIIFMDEPLSGLNELVEKKTLKENIIDLHQNTNKTILYVTHSINDAVTMSDRVVVLSTKPTEILDIYTNSHEKTIELESEAQLDLKSQIKGRIESEVASPAIE